MRPPCLLILYSLAVIAIDRSTLVTSIEFSRLLSFCFLAAMVMVMAGRFKRPSGSPSSLAGWGLVVMGTVLYFRITQMPTPLLAMGLVLAGIRLLASGANQSEHAVLERAGEATLLYFIVLAGYRHVPFWYALIQGYSESVSAGAGLVFLNQALLLGPSTSGFWILLHLVILQLLFALHTQKRKWRALSGAVCLVLLHPIHIAIQNSSLTLGWTPEELIQGNLIYWLMGMPIVLATSLAALPRAVPGDARAGNPLAKPKRQAALLAVLTVLFAVATYRVDSAWVDNNRILLLDEGFVDWKLPDFEKFGPYETGLFGALPVYLEANGWQADIAKPPIASSLLQDYRVLVIINPQRLWDEKELQAVDDFVRSGGSLFVLGDHTDIMGTRKSLNRLLRPYGIAFNFDSGYPVREAFRFCHDFFPHQVTTNLHEWHQVIISVGATLEISGPAYPVIIGRYGFSDFGNMMNVQGAFLGNYAYERGEKFGDIVLAAAARHGKGKVLVFGDTSPLQNGALSFSFDTFAQPTFHWLAASQGIKERNWIKPPAFLCLSILLVVAIRCFWMRGFWNVLFHLLLLAVTFGFFAVNQQAGRAMTSGKIAGQSRAYIDVSHLQTNSLGSLRKEGTGALVINLMRNGFSPYLLRRFSPDIFGQCRLIVSIAPSRPYSPDELQQLRRFVEDGGLFLLGTGYEEKAGSATLLDHFGLDILNVPLGPVPIIRPPDFPSKAPQFINAWPVIDKDSPVPGYALQPTGIPLAERDDASSVKSWSLYTSDHYSIVLFKRIGKGGIIVIGDTFFLGEDNLENLKYYKEGNILFLRDIFHQIGEAL